MFLICKDNNGFEDMLTQENAYYVRKWMNGSVELVDDTGKVRWFGESKFFVPRIGQ